MTSLYRKWRSRSFDDVIGQQHVVRTLQNAVAQHRVAHAYLFTGPRGTGKTSSARILAKAVNCLNPRGGNPCNECEMCVAADEGRAMDVIEIDAASNTSVENVRELRERVAYAAGNGGYKVYIVDEVHRLSPAAFDAFLKTLEEPPQHVIFVFASTEPHKVPETIASRCQRFDFRRISPSDTLGRLQYVAKQEHLDVSDGALKLISLHAGGSLRDALGLLDQASAYAASGAISDSDARSAIGLADADLIEFLATCIVDGQTGAGLEAFHRFIADGGDARQLSKQFIQHWRGLMLVTSGATSQADILDPALVENAKMLSRRLSQAQVLSILKCLMDQDFASKFNIPSELPFELAYVQSALHGATTAMAAPVEVRSQESKTATPPVSSEGSSPAHTAEAVPEIAPEPDEAIAPVHNDRPQLDNPEPSMSIARADNMPPQDISALWPTIVANMRAKSPSLQAVLRSGYLLKVDGGEITVGFLYDFHAKSFADSKKRKLLEEVVAESIGSSYRVTCIRTTREQLQALHGHDAVGADDGFLEEVAERLREFHAKELENGRS